MKQILGTLIIFGLFFLPSCNNTDEQAMKDAELVALTKYVDARGITAKPTSSGLYYIHGKTGIGTKIENGYQVEFYYIGYLLDGTVFDTTNGKSVFTAVLGTDKLVSGLQEGLLYLREGDTATFIMPSSLAYGSVRNGPIPAYSTLIFEVEIAKVTKI